MTLTKLGMRTGFVTTSFSDRLFKPKIMFVVINIL